MIPKRIHYCWFSGESFPLEIQDCIDSWHRVMPDYELVLWDYDRIQNIHSLWLQQCLKERKWAFASDYIRVYALYHFGGIYLDTDVKVYNSFDPFLTDGMFIGREGVLQVDYYGGVRNYLTSHCFGAEAGHSFLQLTLDYYNNRHFVTGSPSCFSDEFRYDMKVMPYIQSRLAESFGWNPSITAAEKQILKNGVVVYPERFFGLKSNENLPPDCYAHHLAAGSWRDANYQDDQKFQYTYSFSYKIRWRIVSVLKYFAKKMGYILVRIEPDHEYE